MNKKRNDFATYSRPELADLLGAIGLDVVYEEGCGDTLIYRNEAGERVEVVDFLGGFGAGLFGHNHPRLVARAQELLATHRPFLVQGSERAAAGRLAARLSDLVGQSTGQSYVTTLANSGTEAVEAALKHAMLVKVESAEKIIDTLTKTIRQIRLGLRDGSLSLSAEFFEEAERVLDIRPIETLDALEFHLLQQTQMTLMGNHCYLAISGAFHGKTTGSLKLTYNRDFRLPWQHVGLRGLFTPRNDEASLNEIVTDEHHTIHLLKIVDGAVRFEASAWSTIAACVIEPIQGEGGIHPLSADYMLALRALADAYNYPLIIDEIQSGMGRTGRFLASDGIRGDYYTLSKSLGGSLAKIGALMVQRDQYVKAFGYLHTSTFADDDFSSEIALEALEILTENEGALIERCADIGDYLLVRLNAIQQQYPTVIREIRGEGLMIGIELVPEGQSPLLRIAAEQNLLGFLLCGYLLHEHQIRVTPTVLATNTIRIEPSAYIQKGDIDRFCTALAAGATLLEVGHASKLLNYITGGKVSPNNLSNAPAAKINQKPNHNLRRVACIAHFLEPEDLTRFDPSLAGLNSAECSHLLTKTQPILDPFIVDQRLVDSLEGRQVELISIGIPYTSAQIETCLRRGCTQSVLDAIEKAVDLAKSLGCIQIGFTGYTSIVTNNCTKIIEDRVGLTSGNSLTAAAASTAMHQVLAQRKISDAKTTLGIVGGIGNIGRALAFVEANRVGRVILFGRRGRRRLEKLATELYAQAWQRLHHGGQVDGIAQTLAAHGLSAGDYASITDQLGALAPIQVSTDLADLSLCNAVLTATNSAEPIIHPHHIGKHPTVICDIAVPNDVAADMPSNVDVIKGGILELPLAQNLDIRGLTLPTGQAYACVTETLLLGFAGISEHFSYGSLRPDRIRQIQRLAREHGFEVVAKTVS